MPVPCPSESVCGSTDKWWHGISRQHAAGEIGVSGIDTGIDHADNNAVALAVSLCLIDVQEVEIPLSVPHRIGSGGRAGRS